MTDRKIEAAPHLPAKVIEAPPASRPEPKLPGFEHRFATVEDVRLHYVIGGKPGGEVVVLVAGFPESWYARRKVMPLLANEYEVVALDLPGQGDSDRPENGYDTEALAAKLHGLLQQLGIDRYFLAAHDVGAWVAYSFAAIYGKEVHQLALIPV
jgi:microsomal epoxide hydrolase